MGSSGWGIRITCVLGAEQAPASEVYAAVEKVIGEYWWQQLGSPWRDVANNWISLGRDSLLTIGDGETSAPLEGVIFWFYESVAWPQGLADHWLRLALVAAKLDLDEALNALGYALDLASVPSLAASKPKYGPFFVHDRRIGRRNGDAIRWETDDDGNGELGETPYDELPADARTLVDEVSASGRCRCPLCEACRSRLGDADVAARDVRIELVDTYDYGDFGRVGQIVVDGEAFFATIGAEGNSWAWLRYEQGRCTHDMAIATSKRATHWLARDPRDGVWVARTADHQTLVSADGRTWRPHDAPSIPDSAFCISARGDAEVWAANDEAVFRSRDAGRHFELLPALRGIERASGDVRVAAIARGVVWVLDGAAWSRLAGLPDDVMAEQVIVDGTAIVVFGTFDDGERTSAIALRSLDGERLTTLHAGFASSHSAAARGPDGRWWWSVIYDQSDSEPGLYTANALGEPWQPVAVIFPDAIFPDPHASRSAWIAEGAALYRVTLT